jgi:hypothetical protein
MKKSKLTRIADCFCTSTSGERKASSPRVLANSEQRRANRRESRKSTARGVSGVILDPQQADVRPAEKSPDFELLTREARLAASDPLP